MNEILIREFQAGEVETLVEIALAAWEPIFAWYRQAMGAEMFNVMIPDWRARKAGQIRAACDPESRGLIYVAESDGRLVGFVTCWAHQDRGWGEIGNNAVHPSMRGQGIGPRLYEHVFDVLRGLGIGYVKVSTGGDPAHAPARRAYQKVGFEIALPGVEYYRRL